MYLQTLLRKADKIFIHYVLSLAGFPDGSKACERNVLWVCQHVCYIEGC
jgi:hypothetical protein